MIFTDPLEKLNFAQVDRLGMIWHFPHLEITMFRNFFIVFVMFTLTGSVGCRFCASPYDYCPPTFTGNEYGSTCGYTCDPLFRAGSRFYGTEDYCSCRGCDIGCSTCVGETIQYGSEYYAPSESEMPVESVRPVPSSGKQIPDAPDPPAVPAVPNKVQSTQKLRTNSNLVSNSTPRAINSNPSYGNKAAAVKRIEAATDLSEITLEELQKIDPSVIDVKFEDEY